MMIKFTGSDLIMIAFWAVGYCWWATLPVAALIGSLGLIASGRWRTGIWVVASVLTAYVGLFWAGYGLIRLTDFASQKSAAAHAVSLFQVQTAPRTIGGFRLPVGARVQWTDDARTQFSKVVLPGPTPELGVPLTGTLEMKAADMDPRWTGTLGGNQVVAGWTCAAGEIVLTETGELVRCTLGAERRFAGYTVPAGSTYYNRFPGPENDDIEVEVPEGRSVAIPGLGTVVPAGYRLGMSPQGTLAKIEADIDTLGGEDSTWPRFDMRGIPVQFFAELHYDEDFSPHPDGRHPLRWIRLDLYGRPTCQGQALPDNQVRLAPDGLTLTDEDPTGAGVGHRYRVSECTFVPKP